VEKLEEWRGGGVEEWMSGGVGFKNVFYKKIISQQLI